MTDRFPKLASVTRRSSATRVCASRVNANEITVKVSNSVAAVGVAAALMASVRPEASARDAHRSGYAREISSIDRSMENDDATGG